MDLQTVDFLPPAVVNFVEYARLEHLENCILYAFNVECARQNPKYQVKLTDVMFQLQTWRICNKFGEGGHMKWEHEFHFRSYVT